MAAQEMDKRVKTTSLDSSFPVLLPEDTALGLSDDDFHKQTLELLARSRVEQSHTLNTQELSEMKIKPGDGASISNFVDALNDYVSEDGRVSEPSELEFSNKMFTENLGVAHRSKKSALLDLFVELERTIDPGRLEGLLHSAWEADSLTTLKIMWNVRSIHLGKAEHDSFYRCLGWLREHHPATLIFNLQWLCRSVIEKKVKTEDPDELVVVDATDVEESSGPDVKYGISHGYFKDLLNLLVLEVQDELTIHGDIREVLHKKNEQPKKRKRNESGKSKDPPTDHKLLAKERRHKLEAERHNVALEKLRDPVYRSLHLCVARLFARQLQKDKALLASDDRRSRKLISLAPKWAPSLEGFHDKYTFIATSVAEALFPSSGFDGKGSREPYLKRAREAYRQ